MLGRKKSRKKTAPASGDSTLDRVAMPATPQTIVVQSGSSQQIQTLPPLPPQDEPSGRGSAAVRVEELQRLMNQNPHLQSLYNGQIDIHQLSELELRRLEARFRSHMESGKADKPLTSAPLNTPPPPPKLSPSDLGPSLGAEGALAPQGLMSPSGLLMSYGFLGPQGLLRPRSDAARPGSLTPKPQENKNPSPSPAPTNKMPPSAPQTNAASPETTGDHFRPVDSGNSAFQTSRAHLSPFAEVLGKFFTLVASLFGLGPEGSQILPGSGGSSGPVITPGSSQKKH